MHKTIFENDYFYELSIDNVGRERKKMSLRVFIERTQLIKKMVTWLLSFNEQYVYRKVYHGWGFDT